jgi:CHAT domain-containing protein/tetratricopeptide (TPR) repeat protein
LCVSWFPSSGRAEPESFRRAEDKYKAGDLVGAAELYRRAADASPELRDDCYERLAHVYSRLAHLDQAIQCGLRCEEGLRRAAGGRGPEAAGARERLRELHLLLGECYLTLGHHRPADRHIEQGLESANARGVSPLPPARVLAALTSLARSAEKRGDRARADRLWARVEALAREQLDHPPTPLSDADRVACVWKLADSYRFMGKPALAIPRLTALLAVHDRLHDRDGKRDTLRRLAAAHAELALALERQKRGEEAKGEHARAEEELRQALVLHDAVRGADRILRGDLAAELALALERQKRADEAKHWHQQAADEYRAVLEGRDRGKPDVARVITAFWKLEKLYQRTNQYLLALGLAESQAGGWPTTAGTGDPRVRSEQGALKVLLGVYADARGVLRAAVADLEKQSPPNLVDLPRALNNLAVVEEATGDPARAGAQAQKCLALYKQYELADDLVVVEAHNVLGTSAAELGGYDEAVRHFNDGIALCKKLGPAADGPLGNLLLNLALVHKSQNNLPEAQRVFEEARKLYLSADPDPIGRATFDAVLAGLHAVQGQIAKAYELVPGILETCKKYGVEAGPLVVTARHCRGLHSLAEGNFPDAEQAWQKVRALQEKQKYAPYLPRTLNYLGLTAERQARLERAEELYRKALDLQRDNPRAFPITHFITLWRLSCVAERRGRPAEARALLEKAADVVDVARLRTYGAAQERAAFFAQCGPGLEQLVNGYLRDGNVEAAFAALTRARSRTLLDQLQLANVDPRTALQGKEGERLRREEEKWARRISGLRARAQLVPLEEAEEEKARELLAALDEAQREYAAVWREILNATPLYRHLSEGRRQKTEGRGHPETAGALPAALRERILGPRTLLLVYHIGPEQGHLLLLGGNFVRPEVFPLTVPAEVAERLALPERLPGAALAGLRGFVLKKLGPGPEPPPPPKADKETRRPGDKETEAPAAVPLTEKVARALVEHYLGQIIDPDFKATRGFRLTPRDPARPVATQRLELLGSVVLPPEARRRIRECGAEAVVVVPDGPLHKVPLEAVLLEAGPEPRYVLDELPPLVYAPSAALLTLLADRPRSQGGPLSLLTVCNPAYPQEKTDKETGRQGDKEKEVSGEARSGSRGVLGLRGQLPLLPFTAVESRRVRALFPPDQVTALEGEKATERAVADAVARRRVLHLAAHGFADEHFGNLFGALAFTPPPPGKETPEDDGFLSLHEIYRLPLADCELAVLSACTTNVGPQEPLEAGVTLASGFLAAGARRVVASHWSVDDESTATLMEAFFARVTAAARQGRPVPYAGALQAARRKVRDDPRWSAPFFWAPFVLVGPAEGPGAGP